MTFWTSGSVCRPRMSAYEFASVSQPPSTVAASRGASSPELLVERELLERADVDLERLGRVDELLFRELCEPVVRGETLLLALRVGELRLVDEADLLPLAHRAVQRLEDLADLGLLDALREEALEGLEGRLVLRRRADDLAVRREGAVDVSEVALQDLAEPVLQLEHFVGRVGDFGLARQHVRELRPARRLRVEPIEGADGREVVRRRRQDAAVARDRAVHVLELDLEHLRVAQTELDEPVGVVALRQVVELRVVEASDVRPPVDHHREALEVAERLLVAVVHRQRARVRLERGRVVAERVLVEARDAVEEVHLLERIRRPTDLHLVDANELRPVARRLVDRLEDRGGAREDRRRRP